MNCETLSVEFAADQQKHELVLARSTLDGHEGA